MGPIAWSDSYIDILEMGVRWYSPRAARWLSADIIVPDPANPQSLNRYAYVSNNPIKYVDPFGYEQVIILYGIYPDTDSFEAAATTQYQKMLEMGYSEEDILLLGIETDAGMLQAISQSDRHEIEYLYVFAHGWDVGDDGLPNGGLQLNIGRARHDPSSQFTSGDIDHGLRDRFSIGAEFHINACLVGGSLLPRNLANSWDVDVYATSHNMKFWEVKPWLLGEYHRKYEGDRFAYDGSTEVIMSPYLLGKFERSIAISIGSGDPAIITLEADLTVRYPGGVDVY